MPISSSSPVSMAIPPPPLLPRLLLALAAILSFSLPAAVAVDLRILHAFNHFSHLHYPDPFSPSSFEATLHSLTSRDDSRLLALADTTTPSMRAAKTDRTSAPQLAYGRLLLQTPTYLVRAGVGTPPQTLLLAVDTSNDAAWIPCTACAGCPSSSPPSPLHLLHLPTLPCDYPLCSQVPNPSCPSATDGAATCSFNLTYGFSSFQATLVQDSLSLAADVISSYTFGCLQTVTGASLPPQGLLGLGRGPASLPSQTRSRYAATFSYCLPSVRSQNFSGSLRLGPAAQPRRIHSTPLLANPRRPSLYYVNMIGIRVGGRSVRIPPEAFAFDPETGGGTIIDSGTLFTRLVAPAYEAVRDEFRRRVMGGGPVTSLGGFDTCYSGAAVKVPAVELEFEGMRVPLPEDNVVIRSSYGNTVCLAMAASPGNMNSVLNVVASMAQQNHRVVIDGAGGRLGIARERCT
uniref:Aspartyl protease 25 n=1 Tax=Elaeis guineensis var. tenera TaxID=51953 RepID=A0A6I9R8N6_ELAGV|nr:aspartyl protease 25 [Elaeis guineensis]